MRHPVMPKCIAIAEVFFLQLSAVGEHFVAGGESHNQLGDEFVVRPVVAGKPMAVVDTLSLCPYLFAGQVFGVVPAYEVNTPAWGCLIDDVQAVGLAIVQWLSGVEDDAIVGGFEFYRFAIEHS